MSLNKLTILFRGIAFAVDTLISTAIAMLIVKIAVGELLLSYNYSVMFLGLSLLSLRDIFGRSVGKHLLGLNIVNATGSMQTRWYQRLLKNITTPLSIIEIFLVVIRKDHKRIGDKIAKTETQLNENSSALSLFHYFVK